MKIERIAAANVGALQSIEIDLRPWQGKVVALTGDNGSGKTTILELIPGALFRETPSQGAIGNLAHETPGFAEVDAVADRRYRVTQRIGPAQSSSVVTWDGDDRDPPPDCPPVIPSGKVSDFDTWAEKAFPAQELYFTGMFAAQSSGKNVTERFIDMKAADRKAVLLRAIGVERLELLAEKARKHKREEEKSLAAKSASVAEVRKQYDVAANALSQVEPLQVRLEEAKLLVSSATAALATARAERDEAADVAAAVRERTAAFFRAKEEIDRLESERQDIQTRLDNNERLLEGAENIRQAATQYENLGNRIAGLTEKLAAEKRRRDAERDKCSRLRSELARVNSDIDRSMSSLRRARGVLRDEESVTNALESIASIRTDIATWEAHEAEKRREIETLRRRSVHGAFDRIESLGERLETLSEWSERRPEKDQTIPAVQRYAASGLEEDDVAAAANRSVPADMERARAEVETAVARLRELGESLIQASALAARADSIKAAHHDRIAADQDVKDRMQAKEALLAQIGKADEYAETSRAAADSYEQTLARLREERQSISARAGMLERLLQADAKIKGYRDRLKAIESEIATQRQVPSSPDHEATQKRLREATLEVNRRETAEQHARTEQQQAEVFLQLAVKESEYADQLRQRLEGLEAEEAAVRSDMLDWLRLAADCGINGLQASEIDGAGPELTALANELLHECYGPRWTVTIETTRLADKGRKRTEGCFIKVLDTERAREGFIESFSGGEKVLIGEAISLALTVLACRKANISEPTLVRDETAGALSEHKAVAYVAMLRHALQMTGAHAVLFVTQSSEVASLADVQLEIRNGSVHMYDFVDEEVTGS